MPNDQQKQNIDEDPGEDDDQANNVHIVEDDGAGFFITGINTGTENQIPQKEVIQAIEEIQDPVDKYKHVAVVDCSKAFSNQEVRILNILFY